MGKGLSDADLKKQLYKWASKPSGSGGQILPGKDTYIYNTTAPLETNLGFEGYGILWWQLDGYERTTFHVYDNVGVPIYSPILYIDEFSQDLTNYTDNDCYVLGNKISTYGYILMLNKSKEYNICYAKAATYEFKESYKQKVKIGEENDLDVGERPEFIFAKNNDNKNSNRGYEGTTPDIPEEEYYVIAVGGRSDQDLTLEQTGNIGGGSGAAYIAKMKLARSL